MLNIFRRHGSKCKKGYPVAHRGKEKGDCNCLIHVEGRLGDAYLKSTAAKTRSMEKARRMVVEAESRGSWEAGPPAPTVTGKAISEAVKEFLQDCRDVKGRNLAGPTIVKYTTILNRLVSFAEQGKVPLVDMSFPHLSAFKRTWPTGGLATAQNITRLRTFFDFCVKHKWIAENPAEALEMPKEAVVERMPYTDEEMSAILESARTIKLDHQQPVDNFELETFILVMRNSGLAISDTALLQKSEIRGDEVRLYRKKSRANAKRVLVVVPLPAFVLERLRRIPLKQNRYYFAHGVDSIAAQVESWRKRLSFVFEAAKIRNPGSHRFRHTFATDLLTRGASIELVSRWLGHSSIKITQQHYSHYVETRIQAASDVLRAMHAASDERKPS